MPRLSVVLLTWNEERNIGDCLAALARQREQDFEAILLDAASTDRTVDIARRMKKGFPVPLRIEASRIKLPIGEARNLGVSLARAPAVAFLSADAEPDEAWTAQALQGLETHDMVFGRQVHAPQEWTVGATVRGLRYAFPDGPTDDPLRHASNVAAAYKKQILLDHPFDPWANAAEDLLLAKRAAADGHRALYDPLMVVRHHDVATVREEMRKNLREGEGCGVYVAELGLDRKVLVWGAAIGAAALLLPRRRTTAFVLGLLWAPAVRRGLRHRRMPLPRLLTGVAASPAFDVAFLVQYLRGLRRARQERNHQELKP